MKKFFLLLFVSLYSLTTLAEIHSGTCGTNLTWTLNTTDSTLTFSGSGAMTDYGEFNKAPWYRYGSYVKTVVVPNGVTSLGAAAFMDLVNMKSFTIPNTVTTLNNLTFYRSGITSINIPASVTSIHYWTFCDCYNLRSITVSSSNTAYSAANGILYNKDKTTLVRYPCAAPATTFTIPSSVTTVDNSAFRSCNNLTKIVVPASVTSCAPFYNCENLTTIEVNSSNTNYVSVDGILFNKTRTTLVCYPEDKAGSSYTIPSSVTTIGAYSFDRNKHLTTIVIPNSVTSIGGAAFRYSDIPIIAIPASVTSIGLNALGGTGCTAINVAAANANFCSVGGVLYNKDCTSLIRYPSARSNSSFTIPSSVTEIQADCFEETTFMESLVIPNSVTSIGRLAFLNCRSLLSLNIPASVTSLESASFQGCTSLLDIIMNTPTPPAVGTDVFYDSYDKALAVPCGAKAAYMADAIFGQFNKIIEQCYYDVNVVSSDPEHGTVTGGGTNLLGGSVIPLTATPGQDYYFVSWNDGNMDNPRNYLVEGDATVTALFESVSENTFPHSFSVAPDNKVLFAPGNLQYTTLGAHLCADGTTQPGRWRFAPHQYDTISDLNLNRSEDYPGWISMFGWGTSGWSGSGAVEYMPYSIGNHGFNFEVGNGADDLTGNYAYADWGVYNSIINGGDQPGIWRTPTSDEWNYLFTLRTNAEQLWGSARVGGINGLLIMPDNYQPGSLQFIPATHTFSTNEYTISQWNEMEAAGALFLPAEGDIFINDRRYEDTLGVYWSSSHNTEFEHRAYTMIFREDTLGPIYRESNRRTGRNVRLLKPVPTYTISATGENGSVAGAGTYFYGDRVTLTATPANDYVFSQWSDGNLDNPRQILVSQDSTFTAEFVHGCTFTGACGENLTYVFDTCAGTLTISGTGEMYDYSYSAGRATAPWSAYAQQLTSLVIEEGITSIGKYAFTELRGLTGSLIIPNSVTSIGLSAFDGCSGFTGDLNIPNSVSEIGITAFIGCSGFTGSLTIPNSVTSIGHSAFYNCSGFNGSLTIPNSVGQIGYNTFGNCSGFTGPLAIPNSINSIGSYAFSGCSGFDGALTLPNSVTSIGDQAFCNCSGLTSIIAESETPAALQLNSFYNVSRNIPVYVPCGAVVTYQTAQYWSEFTNITDQHFAITVSSEDEAKGTADYSFNCPTATLTATPAVGHIFSQWSDGNTENPRQVELTKDTTFTALFSLATYIVNGDEYEYGASITLTADVPLCQHFVRWSDGNTDNPRTLIVTEDADITPVFAVNTYRIIWNNYDGSLLATDSVDCGDIPTYNGQMPYRETSDQYTYTFSGWSPAVAEVSGDAVYTAQFAVVTNNYTISFKNDDGTILQETQEDYGATPVYNGATPVKTATAEFTYTFSGWSPAIETVTGTATYIAQFSSTRNSYTVNGEEHEYGDEVTLTADDVECQRFVRWSDGDTQNPRTIIVTGNINLTPEYEIIQYLISVSSADEQQGDALFPAP